MSDVLTTGYHVSGMTCGHTRVREAIDEAGYELTGRA